MNKYDSYSIIRLLNSISIIQKKYNEKNNYERNYTIQTSEMNIKKKVFFV